MPYVGVSRLSLGHTTLRANNINGHPVITGNYVNPQHELPLPWPDGDWYLRQTFVPAAQTGETVICNSLIPGLVDHYMRVDLLPDDISIIEVEPRSASPDDYGFPATDPLEELGVDFSRADNPYLCSTFSGPAISAQAERLGLNVVTPQTPSHLSNNKSRLRNAAETFGINMLPGATIGHPNDIEAILEADWNTDHGCWIKVATGSGGDLVRRVNGRLTKQAFFEAVDDLRRAVNRAFESAEFETTFDAYWPSDSLMAGGFPLVVEADAHLFGESVINGSTQFVADTLGNVDIVGHFRQITTQDGEYIGNEPFVDISLSAQQFAEEQARRVAVYNADQHGYFGIAAIDWFLVNDGRSDGSLFVGELNSRPTANTPPVIIAQKLGADHFINTNVYTNLPVSNTEDFFTIVGDLALGSPEAGLVVPQSFRTMAQQRRITASPNFKIAILASDTEHCQHIVKQLASRGVRFMP